MLLPTGDGCELYCEPQLMGLTQGDDVSSLTDYSGKNRHLTEVDPVPVYHANVVNSKGVIRLDASTKALKNPAVFPIRCGWIVAKFSGATFSTYNGLLSGTTNLDNQDILTGNSGEATFFNFLQHKTFEFRSNDRIYPASAAPAPMNAFKIIFFRFWNPIIVDGIQLGQQKTDTTRRWIGDIGLVGLYSRDFHEEEVRTYSKAIATNFALTLADVYPYLPDIDGVPERPAQSVNFYDPPEGDRISEVLDDSKRIFDLKFSGADQTEVKEMIAFHKSHYASATPCIYRNYKFTPPEDVEGYIDSPYDLDGANNDFNYSFRFKEK